ncbi:hypothetical protein NQ315_005718, partial [Exocentrus adspersus]
WCQKRLEAVEKDFIDIKKHVKSKITKQKKHSEVTGGGPPLPPLPEDNIKKDKGTEELIWDMITPVAVSGMQQSKTKGYTVCAAEGCGNNQLNCSLSLFRFPKDIERARIWALACGREDLKEKDNLYTSYRLCAAHFENDMFLNYLRNRLKPNVIPSIFPHLEGSSSPHHA